MEVFLLDGPAFVKWIETLLIQNDISKEVFYSESGISTANMTQWRAGDYNPSKRSIEKVERFFESKQKEKPATETGSGQIPNYSKLSDTNKAIVDSMIAQLLAAQLED
jgi:hypothetical protein